MGKSCDNQTCQARHLRQYIRWGKRGEDSTLRWCATGYAAGTGCSLSRLLPIPQPNGSQIHKYKVIVQQVFFSSHSFFHRFICNYALEISLCLLNWISRLNFAGYLRRLVVVAFRVRYWWGHKPCFYMERAAIGGHLEISEGGGGGGGCCCPSLAPLPPPSSLSLAPYSHFNNMKMEMSPISYAWSSSDLFVAVNWMELLKLLSQRIK